MDKRYAKFIFWGSLVATLLGALGERQFDVAPNVAAIVTLTIAAFTVNALFLVALLVAPVKRVLYDTRDDYFVTRLHRLCNMLDVSVITALTLCVLLVLTPESFACNMSYSAVWIIWYNAYRVVGALVSCVKYPSNPY